MGFSIRPIRSDDKAELARRYALLSSETQRRRFLAAKPRLTAADLRYLTEVDGIDHVALVAAPTACPETILAVGRWVRLADDPATAEFAIVVGDAWQRRGIGSALAEALAATAREGGVRRLAASVLHDNLPARRMVERIAGALESERHAGSVDELVYALAA